MTMRKKQHGTADDKQADSLTTQNLANRMCPFTPKGQQAQPATKPLFILTDGLTTLQMHLQRLGSTCWARVVVNLSALVYEAIFVWARMHPGPAPDRNPHHMPPDTAAENDKIDC